MKKNLDKKKILGAIFALVLFLYYIVTWWFLDYAIGTRKFVPRKKDKKKDEKVSPLEDLKIIETNIFTKDNCRLFGKKLINKNSHKWVITIHGYRSSSKSMDKYAYEYYNNGYNVIMPDLRGHGKSGGKHIGMGWLDKEDIKLWIKHIINIDRNAEIVLHGISMGGATVMMLSGDKLPDNIKVIIEDCGYTSVYDIFKSECKVRFKMVHYPSLLLGSLLCKLHIGYGWLEASSVEQLKKNIDIPMLFIHGKEDKFVPFSMLDKVYGAAGCEKEKYVVEGAEHANSVDVAGKAYWDKVFGFIAKYN